MKNPDDNRVALLSYGYVTDAGFGNQDGHTDWPEGSPGTGRLRWRTFGRGSFERFGQLDRLSKHIMAAAELLALPAAADASPDPDVAVVLGTTSGSLDVDVAFLRGADDVGRAAGRRPGLPPPWPALGEPPDPRVPRAPGDAPGDLAGPPALVSPPSV